MPQKWPVGWSDCLSILTVLNACNASVEPSASHELRLFIICYSPNFAQNLGVSSSFAQADPGKQPRPALQDAIHSMRLGAR